MKLNVSMIPPRTHKQDYEPEQFSGGSTRTRLPYATSTSCLFNATCLFNTTLFHFPLAFLSLSLTRI